MFPELTKTQRRNRSNGLKIWPGHGAPGARHTTCIRTSLASAAEGVYSSDAICGRGSQLKKLASHTPKGLVDRTLCGAAMHRSVHTASASSRLYGTQAQHIFVNTWFCDAHALNYISDAISRTFALRLNVAIQVTRLVSHSVFVVSFVLKAEDVR